MAEASSGRTVVKVTMVVVQSSGGPSGGLRSRVCTRAMSRSSEPPRALRVLGGVVRGRSRAGLRQEPCVKFIGAGDQLENVLVLDHAELPEFVGDRGRDFLTAEGGILLPGLEPDRAALLQLGRHLVILRQIQEPRSRGCAGRCS